MAEDRKGKVITFYSYKGGTGRTMALANVAWILAANGKRVLVADWDLESPGLHRFFRPFIDAGALASSGGVIGMIYQYEWAAARQAEADKNLVTDHARVHREAFSIDWKFPGDGTIDFLSAGEQNKDYAATLSGLDWENFYNRLGGGQFLDALRADMRLNYDYALIDSRTGLSDVADICTIHLPDVLVDCFTLSDQGIEGAATVARWVQKRTDTRKIRILPVPMRVDPAEKAKAEAGMSLAMQRFDGLPVGLAAEQRSSYWANIQVPYQAFYGYEETLATFGDPPGSKATLLSAFETLTRHITEGEVASLPAMDPAVRNRVKARFARPTAAAEDQITLRYDPHDQLWAEWVEHILVRAGVRVDDPWNNGGRDRESRSAAPVDQFAARELVIISRSNVGQETNTTRTGTADGRAPLVVYVSDLLPLPGYPLESSVFLAGLRADAATEQVLALVGRAADAGEVVGGMRYPGDDAVVFDVPARNARFTGRDEDLRDLRARLRSRGTAAVLQGTLPVTLQGMGGIGKSQVAMEYAYRFGSAYDVVWWITADPVMFIDASLADLGLRLNIPVRPTSIDNARAVLQALSRGEPYSRWLLIYDNAELIMKVGEFIPHGSGHVLITSRNTTWGDRAESVHVDVFRRRESIAHLIGRVPTIAADDANRVAEMLGDLPIAIAAAAAWLADTGAPVSEYLRQLEQRGPSVPSAEDNWEASWDLSLTRLRERSAAAYRLLQLCSVVAPEISVDLVYSEELARVLVPLDPTASEQIVRAALVQQITRLSLIRLDMQRTERRRNREPDQRGQVQIHRLLQHVVRTRMTDEELATTRHQIHLMLAASRPDGEVDDPGAWPRFRLLWPHLAPSEAVNCQNEAVRRLLIDRVRYLGRLGDLQRGQEEAETIQERWTQLLETLTDESERLTLRRQLLHLRFNLANILRDRGLFHDARQLDEEVLDEQRLLLGHTHPHTLMTAGSYAADLRGLGEYAQALEEDKATYEAWFDIFGEDNPRTLNAMSNLAVSFRLTGDFRNARERDEQVYKRRSAILPEHHPTTLQSASAIGRDLREAGEYERSAAWLTAVSETIADVYGTDSRDALTAKANLAVSLRRAGRPEDANELLETAFDRLTETLGPRSPDTLACRLSRAVNLFSNGHNDRARRELEEVRKAYEDQLGRTHPHPLVCANNLATVARAQGDSVTARRLATESSGGLESALGDEHPHTLAARMNLAVCLADEGNEAEAAEQLRKVAVTLSRVVGPNHPDTLRCNANLAILLLSVSPEDPQADLRRAVDALTRHLGVTHPDVRAVSERRLLNWVVDPHPF